MILDSDLAELYGVSTKRLNEQVRRNIHRFPEDFLIRVSDDEARSLRSQFATSNVSPSLGRGGRRYPPLAFTEHGAIQAANVLNSARAAEMGIFVVRAFVHLRRLLQSSAELARRLDELESRIQKKFASQDETITAMLTALRELLNEPPRKQRGIGFTADLDDPE